MKRLLLVGAAALTLTLATGACGSVQPNAAVVNGRAIRARDVEADVAALVALNAQPGQEVPTGLPGTAVRQILGFEILSMLFATDPAEPLTVDQAAIDTASAQLGAPAPNGFGDKWLTVSTDVRRRLSTAAALTSAAQQRSGAEAEYTQKVTELLAAAKVKVNPRYGSWDPTAGAVQSLVLPLTTR